MIIASHNTGYLAAKIQPYVYQITKDECLQLPEKLYSTEYFYMSDDSRGKYEKTKEELLLEIDYDNFKSYTIFKLFTALQKIVSTDFFRYDILLEIIKRIPEKEKIIIFCKYIDSLNEIFEHLNQIKEFLYIMENCQKKNVILKLKNLKLKINF